MERILHALAKALQVRGGIDISEAFIDGTFPGSKRGVLLRENKAGKGTLGAESERDRAGRGSPFVRGAAGG